MIRSRFIKVCLFVAIFVAGCKDRYDPGLGPTQTNFLVVEGIINAAGVTTITLGRTLPLNDTARTKPEINALVTVESDNNATFAVREISKGIYQSDFLSLPATQKYRLHIKTSSNGEYLSEFVNITPTPLIDSVNWRQENDGIRIYANTHDANDNTRYYKWEFEETWEIHSAYANRVKYESGVISFRDVSEIEKLYRCWSYQNSASILLASSAQLQNNIISLAPIQFIPAESEKTSVRYSIFVKQYSLDRKAYDFYKLMKSNTETLGSVFDPLPSEIAGNITCVSSPLEKVIGYVAASTTTQKRIFISSAEINSQFRRNCFTQYIVNHPDSIAEAYAGGILLPYESDGSPPSPIKGYFSSTKNCIDCTTRGFSEKPPYW